MAFNPTGTKITGGTGSFGKAFINRVLNEFRDIQRVVIYSRDDSNSGNHNNYSPNRNIPSFETMDRCSDKDRLRRALEKIDTVVHAAALKQVPCG